MNPAESVKWTPPLVRVVAGLMIALFLTAIDSTVVATAIPTIGHELGGFRFYPWVFSAYLLTSTTSVPLWGRVADVYGRRPALLGGSVVFVVASVLCGLSQNIGELIVFRAAQGIGGGAVGTLVFTVVSDIFPSAQRARLQGVFGTVWAVAAVAGPLTGATLVSTIGWRWIFGINLPVGVVACALLWTYRDSAADQTEGRVDIRGTVLLSAGVPTLLYGLGTGSVSGRPVWPALVIGLVVLMTFAWFESRCDTPMLPLYLLRDPVAGPALIVTMLSGAIMFGATAYVPLYVQQVLHRSAYAAGTVVASMFFAWPVAAAVSGWNLGRIGHRKLVVAGSSFLVVGTTLLWACPPRGGLVLLAGACSVIGFGMGLFTAPLIVVAQDQVSWSRRGAVTAMTSFVRTIGGSAGVALFGVLLQIHLGTAEATVPVARVADGLVTIYGAMALVAFVILFLGVYTLVAPRLKRRITTASLD